MKEDREKLLRILNSVLKDAQVVKIIEGKIEFSNGYDLICDLKNIVKRDVITDESPT